MVRPRSRVVFEVVDFFLNHFLSEVDVSESWKDGLIE